MTELPKDFKTMLHYLIGGEASDLIKSLDQPPVTSIRLNKRKPRANFPDSTSVPWCSSGFYLRKRPEFILDPLLHAGAYYVQDASSMIYETVVSKLLSENKWNDIPLHVLDLCAAPGGKTTAIINSLSDESWITANEYSSKRVNALKENLAKWGFPNVTITNKDTDAFSTQEGKYDIVAVDAPCSGEGMMRKEEMARIQWSHKLVEECSILQRRILLNAITALKPGGFLIYSTCTFNRKENEENAEFIVKNQGMEPIDMKFPEEWGIGKGIDSELPLYRFMPHKTRGEGLFLSVFRKQGEWEVSKRINGNSNLETYYDQQNPKVNVDITTALSYLRRESIKLPEGSPKGLVNICYEGLVLGEAKNIGSRANNLYPKNWRILKR